MMESGEEWRPALGSFDFSEKYEVSNRGEVRNKRTGRVLKQWTEFSGHKTVSVRRPNGVSYRQKVHRMVAITFIENPDFLPFVRHLNDIPGDNRVENLAWGDASSNGLDAVRNGAHPGASRTHCPHGHQYNGSSGRRTCKECDRARAARKRSAGLPDDDPRHGTSNGYRNFGCRCKPCLEADRQYKIDLGERRARKAEEDRT